MSNVLTLIITDDMALATALTLNSVRDSLTGFKCISEDATIYVPNYAIDWYRDAVSLGLISPAKIQLVDLDGTRIRFDSSGKLSSSLITPETPHIQVARGYIGLMEELVSHEKSVGYTSFSHLIDMCKSIIREDLSPTRANRWLGYVQGVLVTRGLLSVDEERDLTRQIFKGA